MAKIGKFRGNPVITLGEDEEYPFIFGVRKAELILENIDNIKSFYEEYKSYEKKPKQKIVYEGESKDND